MTKLAVLVRLAFGEEPLPPPHHTAIPPPRKFYDPDWSVEMPNKFAHIKQATVDTQVDHPCHWPGCKVQVPRAHLMCRWHWMTLPKLLRDRVLEHYVMGQELHPSMIAPEYFDAVNAALSWANALIAANASRSRQPGQ